MRLGGSTKGTTLAYGDFGLRLTEGTRLSAKQLQTSFDAIKKAIKPVKGAQTCVSTNLLTCNVERRLTWDSDADTCGYFQMFRCALKATRLVWVKAKALLNTGVLGMFRSSVSLGVARSLTFPFILIRVPIGKMVFEVGGGGLRQEIAQGGAFPPWRTAVDFPG